MVQKYCLKHTNDIFYINISGLKGDCDLYVYHRPTRSIEKLKFCNFSCLWSQVNKQEIKE